MSGATANGVRCERHKGFDKHCHIRTFKLLQDLLPTMSSTVGHIAKGDHDAAEKTGRNDCTISGKPKPHPTQIRNQCVKQLLKRRLVRLTVP